MASSRRSASKVADLPGDVAQALAAGVPGDAAASALHADPDRDTVAVAFSGGLDSTVLLHAAVRALGPARVLAVHVDHRLQAGSSDWAAQCEAAAAELGVAFALERLIGQPAAGDSVEAWAREGRYSALARVCAQHGVRTALTAHHADDQAETLLLRLARGTGPDGLSAIAPVRRQGDLLLRRPLLSRSRAELEDWARAAGLRWLDDPSNADPRFRRNQIRSEVLPALERAVPGARRALARAAGLGQAAREVLAEVAAADLAAVAARGESGNEAAAGPLELDRQRLLAMPPARRAWVLRHWLSGQDAPPPSAARLAEVQRQLLDAPAPSGLLTLDDRLVLRHRDRLLMVPDAAALQAWLGRLAAAVGNVGRAMDVPGRYPVPGGAGAWIVSLADEASGVPGLPAEALRATGLRFESGARTGLRLRVAPGGSARSLKNLYQEQGVPGWQRGLYPVLAVGERALWSAAFGADRSDPPGQGGPTLCLQWSPGDEPAAAARLRALFSGAHPV